MAARVHGVSAGKSTRRSSLQETSGLPQARPRVSQRRNDAEHGGRALGSPVLSHRHPKSHVPGLTNSPRLCHAAATSTAASPTGTACRCPLRPPPSTHLRLGTTGAIQEPATPAARSGGEGPGSAHTEGALCRPTKPSLCSAAPTAPVQTNADIPYCFPRKSHPGEGGEEEEGRTRRSRRMRRWQRLLGSLPPPAQPLTRGSAAPALRGSARSLRGGWGGRCSPPVLPAPGPGRAEPGRAGPTRDGPPPPRCGGSGWKK